MSEHVKIADNPAAGRYEASIDDTVVGFAEYEIVDSLIAFTHTVVEEAYKGQGIGTQLVAESLADVRGRGLVVRPVCEFYRAYFDDHPEVADLLGR